MPKQFNVRLQFKIDTIENWAKAISFTPKKGEPTIFIEPNGEMKMKIGDGKTLVNELNAINDSIELTDIDDICGAIFYSEDEVMV